MMSIEPRTQLFSKFLVTMRRLTEVRAVCLNNISIMKQTAKNKTVGLRSSVLRTTGVHFVYAAALVAQIIIYDAWKLITPTMVMQRWLVAAVLLVVTTLAWYIAKSKPLANQTYRWLVAALVATDIFVASFLVYSQRGMASRAVLLYVIPLVTSAVLLSRSAILATAALSAAAYTSMAISYFVLNFNEGYKIELYGEVGFYTIVLFIVALLLCAVVWGKPKT